MSRGAAAAGRSRHRQIGRDPGRQTGEDDGQAAWLAMPFMGGFTFGPTVAALVWERVGYALGLGLVQAAVMAGLGAVFLAARVG